MLGLGGCDECWEIRGCDEYCGTLLAMLVFGVGSVIVMLLPLPPPPQRCGCQGSKWTGLRSRQRHPGV